MMDRVYSAGSWIRLLALCFAMVSCAVLTGCKRETQTVTEVKRAFAIRAMNGEVQIGTSGRLAAREVNRSTLELLDVRFDIGGSREQDLLMHAERAEIIIDTAKNTMMIQFHNVTAATTEGGITQEPSVTTQPWPLSVRVVPD